MKKGEPWLKTTLVQCAWAAARTKDSYFHAQYHRLRSRRGPKKAIGAVASSLLTTAYHMLKSETLYQDLGANHFNHRAKDKQVLHLIHRLKNLGFNVQITPSPDLIEILFLSSLDLLQQQAAIGLKLEAAVRFSGNIGQLI